MSVDSKLPRLCVLEVRTYKKKYTAVVTSGNALLAANSFFEYNTLQQMSFAQ